MKVFLKMTVILLVMSCWILSAGADVNVNLLNLNSPASQKLQQTYANAYGFAPTQVAPVMMAPSMEVPTILQIAKNAGTMPVAIWGLRKMGMSYTDILQMYTLPPSVLVTPNVPYERYGMTKVANNFKQYGNQWPRTVVVEDPDVIRMGQINLLTVGLRVPSVSLIALPPTPVVFNQVVLNPWGYPTYILPPGQVRPILIVDEPVKIKQKKFKHKKWKWRGRENEQ